MKYYIIKPKSKEIDQNIVQGLKELDTKMELVNSINNAECVILQKGWTRSPHSIKEYQISLTNKIPHREGYLFTDKYRVKLN